MLWALPSTLAAQSDQKRQERQERRVDTLFSMEERNSLQLWFQDNVKKMNLDEDTRDLYASIVNTHMYKISRTNDKDSELTVDERKEEIDNIVSAMNSKVKPLLSEESYNRHVSVFTDLKKILYNKEGWQWKEK
jgi:hypothetical protein